MIRVHELQRGAGFVTTRARLCRSALMSSYVPCTWRTFDPRTMHQILQHLSLFAPTGHPLYPKLHRASRHQLPPRSHATPPQLSSELHDALFPPGRILPASCNPHCTNVVSSTAPFADFGTVVTAAVAT
jgi:hypothetical protein